MDEIISKKFCMKCETEKPLINFTKQKKGKFGVTSKCKDCRKVYFHSNYIKTREIKLKQNKRYKQLHKEQYAKTSRLYNLKRKYNLTEQDYQNLLNRQNSRCAICGGFDPGGLRQYLSVDHDHVSGKIRGLLCDPCNNILGKAKDNIDILKSAISYLERNK